jgi:hypothetical protein
LGKTGAGIFPGCLSSNMSTLSSPVHRQNGASLYWRVRTGIFLSAFGFFVLIVGAKPEWLGLNRSPIIGFVQTAVLVIGVGILIGGGIMVFLALWGQRRSILADIGLRLVYTGYVMVVFAGMADVFGFGSHSSPPNVPFFGLWQAYGVVIGEIVILIGFLLMLPISSEEAQTQGGDSISGQGAE